MIDRNVRKLLARAFKEGIIGKRRPYNQLHHTIATRAYYRDILDRYVENGEIAVYRSGRDCDCVSYSTARIQAAPSGAVEFMRFEEAHYEWLDGPESTNFGPPSECEEYSHSRDLAMEAYEDGHPHVIYA